MEYITYRKMYLLIVIIVLILATINKSYIDKKFRDIIFNPILKIAVLTYLTYRSMFTMEFSLFTAVVIVSILELIDEIKYSNSENFNQTTDNQNVSGSNVTSTPTTNTPTNNISSNNQQTSVDKTTDTDSKTTTNQPTTSQPTTSQSTSQPTTSQPTSKVTTAQPTTNQLRNIQPASNQPASNQPTTNQATPLKVDTNANKVQNSSLSALDSVGITKSKIITSNPVTTTNNKLASAPSAINSTLGLPNTNNSKKTLDTNVGTKNSGTGVGSFPQTDDNFVLKDSSSSGTTNVNTKVTIICKPTIPKPVFLPKDNDKFVVRFVINTSVLTSDGICESNTTPVNINMTEGIYKVASKESDIDNDEDYLRVNYILVALNTEEKDTTKGVNLLIKQGYKLIMISKTGKKVEFSSTYDEDTLFIESDNIKKGLLNLYKIEIVPI
jgi:hypothetical protein